MSDSFVAGNFEDKYHTSNPISKYLVSNFLNNFKDLMNLVKRQSQINTICEVGCGEGELLKLIRKQFPQAEVYATDLSQTEIQKAEQRNQGGNIKFSVQNIEGLSKYQDKQFDLVICAEVLEHVNHPKKGLEELKRISKEYVLLSVPNEPVWRLLNMIRGKYLLNLGNTPGHVNHWHPLAFTRFVKQQLLIVESRFPLPWQMKLVQSST